MSKKVLVADDSVVIQKSIGITFAQEDFEVKFVSNGQDALKQCSAFMPDLLIADVTMPQMGGVDLTKRLSQDPKLQNIPVLLLAGARDQMDAQKAQAAGATDVMMKPFDSNELIQKVQSVLSGQPAKTTEAPKQDDSVFGDLGDIELDVDAQMDEDSDTKDFVPFSMDESDSVDLNEMPQDASMDAEPSDQPETQRQPDAFATEVQFKDAPDLSPKEPINVNMTPDPAPQNDAIEIDIPEQDLASFSMDETPDLEEQDLPSSPDQPLQDEMDAPEAALDTHKIPSSEALSLSEEQIERIVTKAFQNVIERIAWEVVPDLAERIIKEELKRLTRDEEGNTDT